MPIKRPRSQLASDHVDRWHQKHISTFIDKVSFGQILFIWLFLVMGFGIFYHFAQTDFAFLQLARQEIPITSIWNAIYFSFVAATTTGFGDMVPFGYFKILATIEVVISLLVVAVVTSKFISLKQDRMLDELYEITFTEQVHRMRSGLLLFRQNMSALMHRIEDGEAKQREIDRVYVEIATFKENVKQIAKLLDRKSKTFSQMEGVDAGLLTNSVVHSYQRLLEFLELLNEKKFSFLAKKNIFFLQKSIEVNELFFTQLRNSRLVPVETYDAHYEHNKKIIERLNELREDCKVDLGIEFV